MAAKWIKHLYGLFHVTKKEASRSGQRSSLVRCFLFPLSLFFFLTLSVLLGQGWGRPRTEKLGEMGRKSDSPNISFTYPCKPHLLLFLLMGKVGKGRKCPPSVR